jgi:NAD(P)-dependent dehydrogenase (short-subunit alcohol dehydrogenase family)
VRLLEKVALVTGAGRGIGRAIARAYAREGAHVAIAEIDFNSGEEAAAEISAAGRHSLFVQIDLSRKAEIDAMVDKVFAEFQRIDILVNNAGIHLTEQFLDVGEEDYDRLINTNLKGPFFCGQAVGRHMAKEGRGSIVNISSVSAEIADSGSSAYCVSKGGMQMLTRAMALELARYHVRVNAIMPGTIRTDLGGWYETEEAQSYLQQRVPWGRFGRPDEVAGSAIFLASDESEYVTGASILVDGGLRTA